MAFKARFVLFLNNFCSEVKEISCVNHHLANKYPLCEQSQFYRTMKINYEVDNMPNQDTIFTVTKQSKTF